MALPWLPESEIIGIFSQLETQNFEVGETVNNLITTFKRYYKKSWILGEKNLSVLSSEHATNNGAETFHEILKSVVKVHHPNSWKFVSDMKKIIIDSDSEYQRLEQGLNITRNPKRNHIVNVQFRKECKRKLMNGIYSNQQYLHSISITIGNIGKQNSAQYITVDNTETEHEESSE